MSIQFTPDTPATRQAFNRLALAVRKKAEEDGERKKPCGAGQKSIDDSEA